MQKFKPTPLALLISLAFASPMVMAQQATDVGQINVQGLVGGTDSGLIIQEESGKARSAVNRVYMDKLNPSTNAFQVIELLPGVNTYSSDATGLFGGGIRIRGFAGDQIGLTINGAPVNDSGNFAVYPQEYTDSENLCEVFVTQGSADTDAPHVGASGGNIGMVTCAPSDKFGMRGAVSAGQLKYKRTFVRLDTGKFGPSNAKAFISYSKTTSLKKVSITCRNKGAEVEYLTADVRFRSQILKVATGFKDRFGDIDLLIANAGIALPSNKIESELTVANKNMQTNYFIKRYYIIKNCNGLK